ncbi:putative cytochrome c assembly protein [Lupinus albus]|uniref:Putative cytochrome c assembly protein n=1 Tax=Lupinus albus TaxID=3870 RepID=A0A6A4NGT2_LUPAL|nr:putative cytochrome c assembly protein [Lupinus albus]
MPRSWWAYHEIGHGGWWFRDPVKNASFMPWVLTTSHIQSVILPIYEYCYSSMLYLRNLFIRSRLLAFFRSLVTYDT